MGTTSSQGQNRQKSANQQPTGGPRREHRQRGKCDGSSEDRDHPSDLTIRKCSIQADLHSVGVENGGVCEEQWHEDVFDDSRRHLADRLELWAFHSGFVEPTRLLRKPINRPDEAHRQN